MKTFIISTCIMLLMISLSMAQTSEEHQVKQTIEDFFEAFHNQDTTKLKSLFVGTIPTQSINILPNEESILNESNSDTMLESITIIPAGSFKEVLLSYDIRVTENMASAWTPYQFIYQDKFRHCGVNAFQLMKHEEKWKIIHLVDTRQRDTEKCKNINKLKSSSFKVEN